MKELEIYILNVSNAQYLCATVVYFRYILTLTIGYVLNAFGLQAQGIK